MTDTTNPSPADEPKADETFTWTNEPPSADRGNDPGAATATSILESVRDVVDDLAERAGPTVRELSARAAELTAIAADRAAPLAKRVGEVTADASGKLATKSREWASELRASVEATDTAPAADADAAAEPTAGFEPAEGSRETREPSSQG